MEDKDHLHEVSRHHGNAWHHHLHTLAHRSFGHHHNFERLHFEHRGPRHHEHHEHEDHEVERHKPEPKPFSVSYKKAPKQLISGSVIDPGESIGGKYVDKYPGSSVARGTFKHPSPLEGLLMDEEGDSARPKSDGLSGHKDFGAGIPAYKYGEYVKKYGVVTPETRYMALQDQIQFKIGQLNDSSLGNGFAKMNEHQQTAFMSYAYNLDISKYESVGHMGNLVRSENIDKVGDAMMGYKAAGGNPRALESRRKFESKFYNDPAEGLAYYKQWKGI
jgi:GH24 family phage-related lysozyme (muramidase)